MKKITVFFLWGSVFLYGQGKYDFLQSLESPRNGQVEKALQFQRKPAFSLEMADYYKHFQEKHSVKIYLGFGIEAYDPRRASEIFQMLQRLSQYLNLRISKWKLTQDGKISFTDTQNRVDYSIVIGNERNEFAQAFSKYDVVMYHGHSRYGRGPAFGSFTNYFRMGSVFPTIEVDTRNRYFQEEPIQKTSEFPLQDVTFNQKKYFYQYRGQKTESSYLPQDAYTKNIAGFDTDLKKTTFLNSKQLLYFYSCSNQPYFEKPIRALFPQANEKLVFGTVAEGMWGSKPHAVFVMSLVAQTPNSLDIVRELNATGDCKQCFTSY